MTDEQTVELFQKGNKDAGERLLIKYKNYVLKIARRFFLSGGDTEDLVQEGMCGLYSAMVTFSKQSANFSTYAYTCIKNRIIDAVKVGDNNKNAALNNFIPIVDDEQFISAAEDSPEEKLIKSENESEFMQKMKVNLSSLEYKAMALYLSGSTLPEISKVLNKPYKSIDNAIARSKHKLQKIFALEK
jgi:RNA polymerase sporulation-specific sigma factor